MVVISGTFSVVVASFGDVIVVVTILFVVGSSYVSIVTGVVLLSL